VRDFGAIEPSCVETFIVCRKRFSVNPIHPEHVIQVLGVIAIGITIGR